MKQAVAIFAKTPVCGLVKTRLTPPLSLGESAELYRCMLLDTIARSSALSADRFICYHGDEGFFRQHAPGVPLLPQRGETLGARLEAALDELRALKYDACVIIGTDSPDLPLSYVEEALSLLRRGTDVVFGPADDGGYYLVGLSCPYGELFKEIPWSGPDVLEKSLERAAKAGISCSLLPAWYDVDGFDDLSRPGLCDPSNGAPLTRAFLAAVRGAAEPKAVTIEAHREKPEGEAGGKAKDLSQ